MSVPAVLAGARRRCLSPTLTGYVARLFAWHWLGFFLALGAIGFLVNSVDLLDRMADKDGVGFGTILAMALLRQPHLSQEVVPFTVLFAALSVFWRLSRSQELVVTRAAGVSVWHCLLPVVAVAVLIGILAATVLNPAASTLLGRYERVEAGHSQRGHNALSLSRAGFWLRQADAEGQSVIHAARVDPETMTLHRVIVFRFGPEDRFLGRIDAARAELDNGAWRIFDAWLSQPRERARFDSLIDLPTDLTRRRIEDSFARPETMSLWVLPGFIGLLEDAGFSARRHRLQLTRLATLPLLLAAMVMLAVAVSPRPGRRGRVIPVMVSGALAGFLLYFLTSFLSALCLSGKIPVILAGCAPAVVCMMLGVAVLMHLEDG